MSSAGLNKGAWQGGGGTATVINKGAWQGWYITASGSVQAQQAQTSGTLAIKFIDTFSESSLIFTGIGSVSPIASAIGGRSSTNTGVLGASYIVE